MLSTVVVCSYLHDTGEWDDKNVSEGEIAYDGVDAWRASAVDDQPGADQTAAERTEHNLNIEDRQTRCLVEHGVRHVRRRRLIDWFRVWRDVDAVRHHSFTRQQQPSSS